MCFVCSSLECENTFAFGKNITVCAIYPQIPAKVNENNAGTNPTQHQAQVI